MIRTMGFLGALSIADVLKQERCARVLRRDDPAAQTAGGGRAPAREDDRGGLRPWRRTNLPPAEGAWMDMYAHDRDPRDQAIEGSHAG